MGYIESQGEANPWEIYCSMDWYFYGLYILQKLLKNGFYIYPKYSKIMALISSISSDNMDYLKKTPLF